MKLVLKCQKTETPALRHAGTLQAQLDAVYATLWAATELVPLGSPTAYYLNRNIASVARDMTSCQVPDETYIY
jgi:hypothetical protein